MEQAPSQTVNGLEVHFLYDNTCEAIQLIVTPQEFYDKYGQNSEPLFTVFIEKGNIDERALFPASAFNQYFTSNCQDIPLDGMDTEAFVDFLNQLLQIMDEVVIPHILSQKG